MKQNSGFTLIEILIAVVIVAILASVAVPAYIEQVAKAKRADAQGALLGLAQSMERFFTENNTYCGSDADGVVGTCVDGDVPGIFATQVPTDGGDPYYNLTITTTTATNYTLTATRTGSMARDANCGDYTLNSVGQMNHTGGNARDYCVK